MKSNVRAACGRAFVLALCVLLTAAAWGRAKYRVLHNFGAGSDGSGPYGSPIVDGKGNVYGVTGGGGTGNCSSHGCGVVFELGHRRNGFWQEKVLHNFAGGSDGAFPWGPLAFGPSGSLFGTLFGDPPLDQWGVFELSPDSRGWNNTVIYTDGAGPGVTPDGAGNLYGPMGQGEYDHGAVGELLPGANGWTYTDLYDFCKLGCPDGIEPKSPLGWDAHGNLYGTTLFGGNGPPLCGGSAGCGVAFRMTPNGDGTWTYHVLHRFAATKTDGYYPYAGLTVDASGTAYGVTSAGGKYGTGTFFKLTPTKSGLWKETILYQFPNSANGCGPSFTLVPDKAGNLYGSGAGGLHCGYDCGTVFKFTPQTNGTWKYSVVHKFNGNDGAFPYGVVLDDKGNLFGTTMNGGKYNLGVAFEITP